MRPDRFEKTVEGVAFAALLILLFLLAGEWEAQDRGLSQFDRTELVSI